MIDFAELRGYNTIMSVKITKKEILNTACGLFREKSFDSVSLDEVCRACGISKPTFYNYVDSKDAILTDYYDIVCQDIMMHFANVYEQNTYYQQFCTFYDIIIDSSLDLGPELVGKMLSLNLKDNKNSFSTRDHLTEIVIPLLRKGQEAGEFASAIQAEELYDAVNFVFLGLELKWCMRKGDLDWKSEFHRITDSLLGI